MGTRTEKRKRQKKEKRRQKLKTIIIFFTVLILYMGIKVVNKSIIHFGYLDNPIIFNMNIRQKRLELFGKSYIIVLKIFKKGD